MSEQKKGGQMEIEGTEAPAATGNIGTYEPSVSSDIDDLIPEELRAAFDEDEKKEHHEEEDDDFTAPAPKKKEAKKVQEDFEPGEDEDEEEEEDDYSSEVKDDDVEDIDEDDLDLSDESIDSLLKGDLDAISKKAKGKAKEEEEKPLWHDDKEYQELVKQASYAGFDQKAVDKIIAKASDKKVLQNGKYTQGLEGKVSKLEESQELLNAELDRLKQIERAAHFDTSEEVQAKYGIPMSAAIKEMQGILSLEGIDVSLKDLAGAKDRATVSKLLEDYTMDDASRTKLMNHWKEYKQLELAYGEDKKQAKKDLSKHLATNISDDVAHKILRNGLSEFMKADERYKYIHKGITEGLEKHPEVSNVLGLAKNNFFNMLRALGAPSDYVHNDKWLSGLSKFMLDAAHNKKIADDYYKSIKEHQSTKQKFVKLVKEYRKLAGSAKGISGRRNGVAFSKKGSSSDTFKDDLAEFKGLLEGKLDIEDLIPE